MDDIGISWPFWKFGLKRDDLFTTLQDQYNTFPSSIQDPEAFHHDVFELSHAASSAAEFHSLMAERKQHRLRELNESLEAASFEIIANPSLIGTDQWQYAVQLFRTRSLDSLVRYFASYLPEDHPWRCSDESSSSSGESDGLDVDSITHSEHIDHEYSHDKPHDDDDYHHRFPPSPQSMTTYSSIASQHDFEHDDFSITPARTMSFSSESESDDAFLPIQDSCPPLHHDDDSSHNPSDEEASVSSVSDPSETHRKELLAEHEVGIVDYEDDDYAGATQLPPCAAADDDTPESETPTPKPKPESISRTGSGGGGGSFFPEPRPSRSLLSSPSSLPRSSSAMPRLRHRDSSAGKHLSLHAANLDLDHISSAILADRHQHSKQHATLTPYRHRRRDLSPVGNVRSRPRGTASSNSNSSSKVQKSSSEPLRSRPRGRRRDGC